MSEIDTTSAGDNRRRAIPAWLLAVALHLAIAALGMLLVRWPQAPQKIDEPARFAEIVLVERAGSATRYYDDSRSYDFVRPAASQTASASTAGSLADALPLNEPPPLVAGIELPSLPSPTRAVAGSGESIVAAPQPGGKRARPLILPGQDDEAIRAADPGIGQEQVQTGPTAQLSLFGSASAEGRSFVFVIDRSASMGGGGLGAIGAAAKELAARLDALSADQTFQVVAYNQSIARFSESGLVPADAENQKSLTRFVAEIAAYGQTEHSRGLLAALRYKPEVVFLLTDGGDPVLDNLQLRTIREQAAGRTRIHVLHFGRGPAPEGDHFLKRLGAENRGSYAYIDMNSR
jgi:hypothetical protein